MDILKLKNYKIVYENKSINFPDIRIKQSEFVGLSGDSGCGKTSLLNSIFGHDFQGEISYEQGELLGEDIKSRKDKPYNLISYCPQFSQDALNPKITVYEHIELVAKANNTDFSNDRLKLLIKKLNLEEKLLDSYSYMLSGGQKQRLMLLLSVIKEPRLLVLDEPSSAIDAITLKIIVEFLNEIRGDMTIIMVSHNYGFLEKLSDRVIKL